jgi:hypothetical protein
MGREEYLTFVTTCEVRLGEMEIGVVEILY